jgi:molybdopterin-containing oxidoreductase family membrane subunit
MNLQPFYQQVEQDVLRAMRKPSLWYWIALVLSAGAFACGLGAWGYQIFTGMGVAGITHPVGWGVYISNFVFWVGIAHSGTLISAVLYLFRARFRSAFNRTAEAMTVIAVMTAALYPFIHLGRVWRFYYLFPYPHQRHLWINFISPLTWDVFAVSAYFMISLIFFYVGLIPDLAAARRHFTGFRQWVYKVLSLGWEGTLNQWRHYDRLYMFLAAFATPLVVSVHSVVSWDFAMSIVPGWHSTIFAPYFVAGAIFSGTAMVITLTVPMRKILKIEKYITVDHYEKLSKVLLVCALIVSFSYIVEIALAAYSGNIFESTVFKYRMAGHYKFLFWLMMFCNVVLPLSLFVKKLRRNIKYLFVLSLFVNVGMWLERFIIVTTSLAKDHSPYSWGTYTPSLVEIGITIGSFGMFFTFFLIFSKVLPVLSIFETKEQGAEK